MNVRPHPPEEAGGSARWMPLLWAAAVGAGLAALAPHSLAEGGVLAQVLGALATLGFWVLFFAGARALYRASRWTLLLTVPALLLVVALAVIQQAHQRLYREFIDQDRLGVIRANWDLVVGEVGKFAGGLPAWLLPGAALALAAAWVAALGRSRGRVFRPLKGLGGLSLLAAALWIGSWLVAPLGGATVSSSPVLSGQRLGALVWEQLHWGELRTHEDNGHGLFVHWLLDRGPVRPPPPPAASPPDAPRPDVLLILLESVRADHLSAYGYERDTTPTLRRWASRPDVVRFDHAFANATFSYFSLVSLVSGLDLRRDKHSFETAPLLWDHLKARGYDTFFYTLSVGYTRYGLDRYLDTPGLDAYRDLGEEQLRRFRAQGGHRTVGSRMLRAFLGSWRFDDQHVERDDRLTLHALRERLRARDPDVPFFGVWELECTHFRYCYPESFGRFEPTRTWATSAEDVHPLVNAYDNAIFYLDHLMGQALEFLEREGLADRTVVLMASDHGEAFFEHGLAFHGSGFQPEQSWVPFLVRVPRALRDRYPPELLANLERNGRRPVQLVDLLPTLLGLVDGSAAPAPPGLDGDNLLAPLPPGREIYLTNHPPFRRAPDRARDHAVIRNGTMRLSWDDDRPDEELPLPRVPLLGRPPA